MRTALGTTLLIIAIVLFVFGLIVGALTECKPGCADEEASTRMWSTALVLPAPFFLLAMLAFFLPKPKLKDEE